MPSSGVRGPRPLPVQTLLCRPLVGTAPASLLSLLQRGKPLRCSTWAHHHPPYSPELRGESLSPRQNNHSARSTHIASGSLSAPWLIARREPSAGPSWKPRNPSPEPQAACFHSLLPRAHGLLPGPLLPPLAADSARILSPLTVHRVPLEAGDLLL